MSGRIIRHINFLRRVQKNGSLIKTASNGEIGILIELVYNLIHNRLKVDAVKKKIFKRYMETLVVLSQIRQCEKARQALLTDGKILVKPLAEAAVMAVREPI